MGESFRECVERHWLEGSFGDEEALAALREMLVWLLRGLEARGAC